MKNFAPPPVALVFALTAFVSGCSSESSDEGGGGAGAAAGGASSRSSCEPTLESLSTELFGASCAAVTCHTAADAAGALDLESAGVATRLVGADSAICGGWTRVVPGSPEDSFLWHKLYSPEPPCGDVMPLGAHLNAVELDCVRQWILQAAPVDGGAGPGCETCGTTACVDHSTDTSHCGACGASCPAGSACLSGSCTCDGSLELCGIGCVDVESSSAHCGGCDMPCAAGAICNVGECLCAGGLVSCGAACVDTTSDPAHCGSCDVACAAGEVCLRGACATGCDTLTQCGSACVDTTSSTLHCGDCSARCASGGSCLSGACECPGGTSDCGGQCINTTSDPSNCGGCGVTCGGGQVCEGGACRCPGGGTACGNLCVDTSSDPKSCGACGNVCGAGQTCQGGTCTCSGSSASFSANVQPILTASCAARGCHSGVRPAENLSLEAGKAYGELVGVASSQCVSRQLVAPGDPSASYLMSKLMGVGLCFGTQMPKAGSSLSQGELDTIGGWICSGAPND